MSVPYSFFTSISYFGIGIYGTSTFMEVNAFPPGVNVNPGMLYGRTLLKS